MRNWSLYESDQKIADSQTLALERRWDHQELLGTLRRLETMNMVVLTQSERQVWNLSAEAKSILQTASPEVLAFNAVPPEGIEKNALDVSFLYPLHTLESKSVLDRWFALIR